MARRASPEPSLPRPRDLPVFARVHDLLGRVLGWGGWHLGAAHAFRDAIRVEPAFARAHDRLGEALGRAGRWAEASEAWAAAVRLVPTSVELQGNLVLALHRAGRSAALAEALYRLTELRPREGELFMLLGAVLRRQGRHDEAIRAFRWAVRLAPAPPTRRFFLGEEVLGRRQWRETLVSWTDARRLAPGTPAAAEAVEGRSPLHRHPGGPLEEKARRRPPPRVPRPEAATVSTAPLRALLAAEDRARAILHVFHEARPFPIEEGGQPVLVYRGAAAVRERRRRRDALRSRRGAA